MECWVKVKGHPDFSVSSCGRIRNDKKNREVSQSMNHQNGYLRVYMDGKKYYVHRVVADNFFDESVTGYDVIHLDGNPRNNNVSNLEVCDRVRTLIRGRVTKDQEYFPYKIHPIRCFECVHRNEEKCRDKPPYFYCYDGEL